MAFCVNLKDTEDYIHPVYKIFFFNSNFKVLTEVSWLGAKIAPCCCSSP